MGGGDFHALMRLRVYSKQGGLLAQRSFTHLKVPGADTSLNTLDYQPSQITYSDAEPSDRDHIPPEYALKMPPRNSTPPASKFTRHQATLPYSGYLASQGIHT